MTAEEREASALAIECVNGEQLLRLQCSSGRGSGRGAGPGGGGGGGGARPAACRST